MVWNSIELIITNVTVPVSVCIPRYEERATFMVQWLNS